MGYFPVTRRFSEMVATHLYCSHFILRWLCDAQYLTEISYSIRGTWVCGKDWLLQKSNHGLYMSPQIGCRHSEARRLYQVLHNGHYLKKTKGVILMTDSVR